MSNFRTNFFGIRLITCSIIFLFSSWRYLKLYTFEDYTWEYFWSKLTLFVILLYVEVLLLVFLSYVTKILSFVCKVFLLVFASNLLFCKVYESILISFQRPFMFQLFAYPRKVKKILSSTCLFYSFQNLIVHWVVLTFGNHTANTKSRIFCSLSFF